MKKSILAIVFASAFSSSAFASDSHSNFVGSVDKFNGTIRSAEQVKDLVKYTDAKTATKLLKAFNEDGKLTAQEIKDSGISDHHFYTGYLGAATTQSQYDARMKEMNGGKDMNDYYVSNRDLKAHGSMVMNQVEAGNKLQDARTDKIVSGLKDLGNFIQAQTPTLPDQGNNESTDSGNTSYDDTEIKNSITQMGDAFEQRVDVVNDYLSQAGDAIQGNTDKIGGLQSAFESQAAHTTSEIARLDGRIDSIEKKTDKLKAGVAGATAIASLTQYTGNGSHHIAVGVGGYDGASALAGGYTYAVSSSTTVRATIAIDSEKEIAVGASVGHSW
ncbi:MAG: YadA C-terminal domain-containing protein [Phocaeicola sp.]